MAIVITLDYRMIYMETNGAPDKPSAYRLRLKNLEYSSIDELQKENNEIWKEYLKLETSTFRKDFPLIHELLMNRFKESHERMCFILARGLNK